MIKESHTPSYFNPNWVMYIIQTLKEWCIFVRIESFQSLTSICSALILDRSDDNVNGCYTLILSLVWLCFTTYKPLWVIQSHSLSIYLSIYLYIYIYIYIYICGRVVCSFHHFKKSQSSFVCTKLNGFKYCNPTLTILFDINNLFACS